MTSLTLQLASQVYPWFNNPGLVGGLLGGGLGIMGGVYGTVVGILAPRGKAPGLVLGMHWTFLAVGVVLLAAGVWALAVSQPYGVWYPLILPGALATMLMLIFTPIIRLRYRQAEHRRLEAEEFRRG